MRDLQAVRKYWLECQWLVQFYRQHPCAPCLQQWDTALGPSFALKNQNLKIQNSQGWKDVKVVHVLWQMPDEKLKTTPTSQGAHWRLQNPNTSQVPEKKMPEDEKHAKGSCAGCSEWWVPYWKVLLWC